MKKTDRARIERIKNGPCMACLVRARQGLMPSMYIQHQCDAHHLLSGGIRRGHDATIALCHWHHRGVPVSGNMPTEMSRRIFGPSLMDGAKGFRAAYGSDDDLLALQDKR